MGNQSRRMRRAEQRREAKVFARLGALEHYGAIGGETERSLAPKGGWEPVSEEVSAVGTRRYQALATTETVAGIFQVHPKTIERWRKRHKLPCLLVGGSVRYDLSDVLRWASARKEGV